MYRIFLALFILLFLPTVQLQAGVVEPEFEGEWVQGAVLIGKVAPGHKLEFLDRQVPVAEDGVFVIGLGRDFPPQATVTVIQDDSRQQYNYSVRQRQYNIQRVEGVPSRTVNPSSAHLERIRSESALVKKARKRLLERNDFRDTYQWPIVGRISGVYGSQRYYNGEPGRPHYGIDIARPEGALVRAPIGGQVTLVHTDMFFSGGTLIVDHGYGLSSTFIHLSDILVVEGQEVKQGEAIAKVGSSGRATGPHLDWRMNWFDQRTDPQLLVPPMEEALARSKQSVTDKSKDSGGAVQ